MRDTVEIVESFDGSCENVSNGQVLGAREGNDKGSETD